MFKLNKEQLNVIVMPLMKSYSLLNVGIIAAVIIIA